MRKEGNGKENKGMERVEQKERGKKHYILLKISIYFLRCFRVFNGGPVKGREGLKKEGNGKENKERERVEQKEREKITVF